MQNDELVLFLNLFLEKVIKPRYKSLEEFEQMGALWIFAILKILDELGDESFFEIFALREVLHEINARMKESHNLLIEKVSLNLMKFKVFYFFRGKWQRIKGNSVTKSDFGLWVTDTKISKLITQKDCQLLICPTDKNKMI